ncbi:MAG: hypothetical protein AAF717_08005 [Bacteroidota bacterium]
MEWFLDNFEWIFSGIGVFVLGLVAAIVRKNKQNTRGITTKTKNEFNNKFNGGNINITQTIISESIIKNTKKIKENESQDAPELSKVKEEFFESKNKIRTFMIKELARARNKNTILQVRNVTDIAEKKLNLEHEETVHELEKIEEEGLIKFALGENELIGPYTPIKLTEKYFERI